MKTHAELPNLVLQAIGAGTWDWTVGSETYACNRVFAEILGLDPVGDTLSVDDWRQRVHPDDLAGAERRLEEAIAQHDSYDATYRIIRPDGTVAWIETQGRAIATDGSGRATRMVGAIRDISNSVLLRQTLAETEGRFMDIVENVPGAILRFEVSAAGDSHYSYLSPGCAEMFQLDMDTIRADPSRIEAMFSHADREMFRAHYGARADAAEPLECKATIRTSGGLTKHLQITARPKATPEGGVVWTTAILDITRQAQLEADLRKSRELLLHTQKQDAIGELSGGIAHDFNNLLTVILGNLELLQEDTDPTHRAGYVHEAIQATRRGSDLTRNLLSFARRAHLNPSVLDLNEVIRGMHNMIHRTLPANISVETTLMGGLWSARLDRSSVESALLNVVINARDAMPDGGRLTVETANVRLTEAYAEERQETIQPGRYVMIAVSDTGTGIAPDILHQVFEPFFTTKPLGKGTGLGLSSVLGFSRQSGGTTRIYSEPGNGTSVKMYFLADPSAPDFLQAPPLPVALTGGQRLRILLVEDEAAVRRVMALRLRAEGYDVTEAETGEDGYRIFLAEANFDLVVTDIVMPGRLMGTGMVRELRRVAPDLRVIFVSGYPTEAAIHGNGVRPDDVQLMKPVSRDDLMRAVETALRTRPIL